MHWSISWFIGMLCCWTLVMAGCAGRDTHVAEVEKTATSSVEPQEQTSLEKVKELADALEAERAGRSALTRQLEAEQTAHERAAADLKAAQRELAQLDTRFEEASRVVNDQKANYLELAKETAAKRNALQNSHERLTQLRSAIEKYDRETAELEAQGKDADHEASQARAQVEVLQTRIQECAAEISRLTEDRRAAQADIDSLAGYLAQAAGHRITVLLPQRGEKNQLVRLALTNAEHLLAERRLMADKRDFIPRSIKALQEQLRLPSPPLLIEAFDISNLSGTDTIASMIAFKDGKAWKKGYRVYKIKSVTGIDDFASIGEAVYRRYSRLKKEILNFKKPRGIET